MASARRWKWRPASTKQTARASGRFRIPEPGRLDVCISAWEPQAKVDRITVTWPQRNRQVVEGVAANQVITITEK